VTHSLSELACFFDIFQTVLDSSKKHEGLIVIVESAKVPIESCVKIVRTKQLQGTPQQMTP
jgi:hypothetical protein